jgi:hypothetical protein
VCESFAHENCVPFEKLNDFGELYVGKGDWQEYGRWTPDKCAADSDHDGFTNGDELGDPCCEWNFGDAPRLGGSRPGAVSCPAHATSIPTDRPSCSSASALSPPRLSAIWRSPGQAVSLAWAYDLAGGAPHCTCEVMVNVTVAGSPSFVHIVRASPSSTITAAPQALRLCGRIDLHQTVTVSLAAVNRAGRSLWISPVVLDAGSTATNATAVVGLMLDDTEAGTCGVGVLPASTIDTAGSSRRAYVPVSASGAGDA